MRTQLTVTMTIMLAVAIASPAKATPFVEIGDAGDLPGSAQITVGVGPLTSISGTLSGSLDVDIFQLLVTGGGIFSATTVGQPGTLFDSQLFLFTAAGLGVYGNDDAATSFRSTLPATHPLTPMIPALYFLAISSFNRDPVSPAGLIFPDFPFTGVVGPTGPGGAQAITGHVGLGQPGTYTIALTGAEPAVIPEPGTLTLVGLGVAALVARRRKASRLRQCIRTPRHHETN